jgi:hypothetical protein
MNAKAITLAVALAAVGFVGVVGAASAASVACTVTDTSNPHFFNTAGSASVSDSDGEISGAGVADAFSTNNPPCDQVGSDGDNEQGIGGAEMPLVGATCPYQQDVANEQAGGGPVTVGHHGDDIYVTNTGGLDVTWLSGIDGQDPAATLAGQTCTGNGIIANDPTTDPADCQDANGANINIVGSVHSDTDPLSVGTNDPASGFSCLDAVDGNEWTFLNMGPVAPIHTDGGPLFVRATTPAQPGDGEAFITIEGANALNCQVDTTGAPSDNDAAPTCLLTIDPDWTNDLSLTSNPGFSLPIQGTIASGVEV